MNENMKIITINEKEYYDGNKVMEYYPELFIGCKNPRMLVKKKNIDKKFYKFIYYKDDEIIISSARYPKSKIHFKVSWLAKQLNDNEDVEVREKLEKAPDIIELTENEKFKSDDGDVLEVETRG
jgi:hypothetical protein